MKQKGPKKKDHLWKKGQSGNPLGRKAELISKRQWMDNQISEQTKIEILDVCVKKALAGKPSMIELILTRVLPPVTNDDTIDIELRGKNLKEKGEEVFVALSEKRLTPSQAHMIFAALCNNAKLIETTEILERIKVLEEAQKVKK